MADLSMDQVKEYLGNLTVVELADLVKQLEDEWGVSASAPVAAAAPAAGGGEDEGGGEAAEEQTEFDVVLNGAGDKKIQVIKAVREIAGLGLKEAKEVVDNPPGTLKEQVSKEDAESFKEKIEEAGGTVELK